MNNFRSQLQPRYRYKIHDKLYDLTEFVKVHPGGIEMFNNLKPDTNITPMIYAYHKNPKGCLTMLPKYEVSSTTDLVRIEYDTNYTYDKYCELKNLVYDEIREKKIPLFWSNKEIAYNALMLSMYLWMWGYCFWNANDLSYLWMMMLAVMNMGFGALVFHETSHYTGFKNQKLNNTISYSIISPIITTEDWKYEHNYLHHSFTNTDYDDDYVFYKNVFGSKSSYNLGFCGKYLLYFGNELVKRPLNAIKNKRINILLDLYLIYALGIYNTVCIMFMTGIIFIFVAQLSHIQHDCIQINTDVKHDFLYNQVSTAMNYKTDNAIIRFICYSLDIQIEHHLFPNIPHSSLRRIQHIVRVYCEKNNIPYVEKPSIFPTIYSHFSYLYKMVQHQR